jgi:long-chain fatty acid transport protein
MKFVSTVFCGLVLLCLASAPAFAGGIINKANHSADYIRTLNRYAATDRADIAAYNPAGIMAMDNGTYAKADLMYFAKDYSNTVPGFGKLDQEEPSIIPTMFLVHKQDRWAGFFTFTIPAGGGVLDFQEGSARTVALAQGVMAGANAQLPGTTYDYDQISDMSLKISQSTVYGFTVGGSVAATDKVSFAVGLRYAKGTREFEGGVTISASQPAPSPPFPAGANDPLTPELRLLEDADSWSGIVGVNAALTEKLNAAVTYISNAAMEYEMEVKKDTMGIAPALGYADGSLRRIDIPGLVGIGLSYQFTPALKVDANYAVYLEKNAEIDTFDEYGNSSDLGFAVEYAFSPRWKASAGYMKTDIKLEANEQINEPEEPKLDANSVGGGFVFSPTPLWDVTLAGMVATYDSVTDGLGITYEKSVWNLTIGAQYRF